MKKLLIVLAILLVAGAGAFAQEASVSGGTSAGFIANFAPAVSAAGYMPQAEINISGAPSDNTSVSIQLDNAESNPFDSGVLIDDWRINSDLIAELGLDLPVSANLTFGYFDTYQSNFSTVGTFGHGFWNTTAQGYLFFTQPEANLAWEWNIGFGDFGLRYWNDWDFTSMAAAFYGSVAGMVNFIAGYAGEFTGLGSGTIFAEVNASIDLGMATLYIPAQFALGLAGTTVGWSSGVKAGLMDMVTVAVEVAGDTANNAAFEYIVPQITATPLDGLEIYADAMIQLPGPSAFKNVDLGLSYQFGALKVNPGIVIGIDDTYAYRLRDGGGWNYSVTGTGMYVILSTSF